MHHHVAREERAFVNGHIPCQQYANHSGGCNEAGFGTLPGLQTDYIADS
jgi:hypothetical protein